ncbi:MAG: hypothetical protein WB780_04395, partial [Candidatus Acidiferrales bacterium]
MILAVAALLFQIAPVAQAFTVEKAAQAPTSAAAPSSPAPPALAAGNDRPTSMNAPLAPVPVNLAPEATTEAFNTDAMNTPAQTSLSTIRVPELPMEKSVHFDAESLPSRKKWLALSLVEHGAAAFDAYATRDAVSHGAREEDPFLRPVANSDSIYAVSQICPVLLDFA